MTYRQMHCILDQLKLSPEEAGQLLGVSGMTLRRWKDMPPDERLPLLYERAFEVGVQQLVKEGRLSADDSVVREIQMDLNTICAQASMRALGILGSFDASADSDPSHSVMVGLSKIGSNPDHVQFVDKNKSKIARFSKMGREWKERIGGLLAAVRSPHLSSLDKFVAYGALFYLLTPVDLIPDNTIFFGLIDDFAILGLAWNYYRERFPKIHQ
jgi:uncharacterized membrane protein YkvA (DUF1232 family)